MDNNEKYYQFPDSQDNTNQGNFQQNSQQNNQQNFQQNNQQNYQQNYQNFQLPKLPNSDAVLILGIVSIPTCICYGVIGLILGIIAIVLANKDKKLYMENPHAYSLSSFNNIKTGQICGIIGTCLSGIYLIIVIVYLVFVGSILMWGSKWIH